MTDEDKYTKFAYHGGPFDRGGADRYYGRPYNPHKYPNGTYNGPEVRLTDPEEIEAYRAGFDLMEDRKHWT
jgi:hypothetical protein